MLAVLVTAGTWYLYDPIYNDYGLYYQTLGPEALNNAWWEVLLFFIAVRFLTPLCHQKINSNLGTHQSQILLAIRTKRIDTDEFQDQISNLASKITVVWVILMTIAVFRINFYLPSLFFPYISEVGLIDPWGRGRVGGGLDAVFALAGYLQIMLTSLFGIVLALSKRGKVIGIAGIIYFLALPFYIFGRTRNTMLAVLLPGIMALVSLRIKGGIILKMAVLLGCFLALDGWFKFVVEHRAMGENIALATKSLQSSIDANASNGSMKGKKHEGFNMFEELGYINYFIANGTYKVNWGERYFAEIVNPIPRVLWPGKPLIGIDYAIARGMAYGEQARNEGGVACSVSTGMIGQGVVNFGRLLGPIAAALLMAIWVAVLARQDLMGHDIGHLLLYAIGLVLTYNMGRDITLLVIYPFVFGWILLTWMNRRRRHATS